MSHIDSSSEVEHVGHIDSMVIRFNLWYLKVNVMYEVRVTMTWADIQFGEQRGTARERVARHSDNQAWSGYSTKLESKLATANQDATNWEVEQKVAVAYARALRTVLEQIAPNHPILSKAAATNLLDDARVKAYAAKGYVYDVAMSTAKRMRP